MITLFQKGNSAFGKLDAINETRFAIHPWAAHKVETFKAIIS